MLDVVLFDKDTWKQDVFIGVVVGVFFILVNILAPAISMGLPNFGLAASGVGSLIVVALFAPVIEEILFRGAVLSVLLPRLGFGVVVSVILAAITFVLYHQTAYGGSFAAASAAFFGAFIFALIATGLVFWRKNLLSGIIVHSIFNIFLLSKLSVVVS